MRKGRQTVNQLRQLHISNTPIGREAVLMSTSIVVVVALSTAPAQQFRNKPRLAGLVATGNHNDLRGILIQQIGNLGQFLVAAEQTTITSAILTLGSQLGILLRQCIAADVDSVHVVVSKASDPHREGEGGDRQQSEAGNVNSGGCWGHIVRCIPSLALAYPSSSSAICCEAIVWQQSMAELVRKTPQGRG
jgi:hypothetical protein